MRSQSSRVRPVSTPQAAVHDRLRQRPGIARSLTPEQTDAIGNLRYARDRGERFEVLEREREKGGRADREVAHPEPTP